MSGFIAAHQPTIAAVIRMVVKITSFLVVKYL